MHGFWSFSDLSHDWNDPCDVDQQVSKEVKAMMLATAYFTILFPMILASAIVLDVAGCDVVTVPLVIHDRRRIH
jgi:hypothetical protein